VFICFLNPLSETRVHEIPTVFFLRLLSRHFYPRVAIVPTIRTIFFVDTPRSSRYIAYLRHATFFSLADASATSMWRPSEGDRCSGRWYGAAIEQQTRRKWSFAIRDRGPRSLSDALTGRTVDKNSGQLVLTDWRWTGMKDLRFRTGTLRTCVFEHALSADQHGTP
jgi:hypothetical protein